MRLIGMLDSPYVRRVAISLKLMGISFRYEPLSVFRDYDAFASVNPVVKAPTFVTDDGCVLMDSSLILDVLERRVPEERRLHPVDFATHARAQRLVGLALAACEKTVQIVYEFNLRPEEKRHDPWIERISRQLHAAYGELETAMGQGEGWLAAERPLQADVSVAVAWQFSRSLLPHLIMEEAYPGIAAFSERAEALPEFRSTPGA